MVTRVGILGGTFNPIHNAHLLMAKKAKQKFDLEQVVFIPAGNPPHKSHVDVDQEHRFRMVELAIAGEPTFSVSRIELDRPGPHFAVDTFTALRELFGWSAQLYYIIGMDSLNEIMTWRQPERLFGLCEFIVAQRPGSSRPQSVNGKVHFMEMNENISSTAIRKMAGRGEDVKTLVPEAVAQYIRNHSLY